MRTENLTSKVYSIVCNKIGAPIGDFRDFRKEIFNRFWNSVISKKESLVDGNVFSISDNWYLYSRTGGGKVKNWLMLIAYEEKIIKSPLYTVSDYNIEDVVSSYIITNTALWRDYVSGFDEEDLASFIDIVNSIFEFPEYPPYKECYLTSIFILLLDSIVIELFDGDISLPELTEYPIEFITI